MRLLFVITGSRKPFWTALIKKTNSEVRSGQNFHAFYSERLCWHPWSHMHMHWCYDYGAVILLGKTVVTWPWFVIRFIPTGTKKPKFSGNKEFCQNTNPPPHSQILMNISTFANKTNKSQEEKHSIITGIFRFVCLFYWGRRRSPFSF